MFPRLSWTIPLLLAAAAAVLAIWFIPSSQDFDPDNRAWNGLHIFVQKLKVSSTATPVQLPRSAALFVIPYRPFSQDGLREIERFVADGGTVVLLDDFGQGDPLLEHLGVPARVSREVVLDYIFNDGAGFLPVISQFSGVSSGVKSVVFDRGSTLRNVPEEAVLARSSQLSFLDGNGSGLLDGAESTDESPVAARFQIGKGVLVLVSDPSLLLNSMLPRGDNLAFIEAAASLGGAPSGFYLYRPGLPSGLLSYAKGRLAVARTTLSTPPGVLGLLAGSALAGFVSLWIRKEARGE